MKFKEIIPARDRITENLDKILGGDSSSGIVCDSGAVCEVGEYVPSLPEPIMPEPDPSGPVLA